CHTVQPLPEGIANSREATHEGPARVTAVHDSARATPLRAHDEVSHRYADEGVELRLVVDGEVVCARTRQCDVAHVPAIAVRPDGERLAVTPRVRPRTYGDPIGERQVAVHSEARRRSHTAEPDMHSEVLLTGRELPVHRGG